ncbi:hypothetical protein REPUB_Repub02eG0089900 [Reevesia pubescens]
MVGMLVLFKVGEKGETLTGKLVLCLPDYTLTGWLTCSHIYGASIVHDKDLSEYTPSLSSSSKNLSCSHQLYNTSSSGYLVEDKLHLKSFSDHAAESSIQASVVIGCGRKQSGGYLDGAAPDGLMGLGPGCWK